MKNKIKKILADTNATKSNLEDIFELFLTEKRKIEIPFSENDLQELLDGKKFNWEFDNVEVKIFNEDN